MSNQPMHHWTWPPLFRFTNLHSCHFRRPICFSSLGLFEQQELAFTRTKQLSLKSENMVAVHIPLGLSITLIKIFERIVEETSLSHLQTCGLFCQLSMVLDHRNFSLNPMVVDSFQMSLIAITKAFDKPCCLALPCESEAYRTSDNNK